MLPIKKLSTASCSRIFKVKKSPFAKMNPSDRPILRPLSSETSVMRKASGGGRPCEVCRHRDCHSINMALLAGESLRSIAARCGPSHSSIARHKLKCLPSDLLQARQAKKISESDFLLGQVCALDRAASEIFRQSTLKADNRAALAAIGERRRILTLQRDMAGQSTPAARGNVLETPEYLQLREAMLNAVNDHPETRLALASALSAIKPIRP